MQDIDNMPLRRSDYWIVTVASMEQMIGGALSTVISVMLPMLQMTLHPELPSWLQGIIGAMGLIGIGIGSFIIGAISDKQGYLMTFRLCPILMIIGSLICYFFPDIPCLICGLIIMGIGVGGGYSLDSSYISELLPDKWRQFMVGVAKATSAIGFAGAALACLLIIKIQPDPNFWPRMALVITALGIITLLMRIRWWESPKWLISRGKTQAAEEAVQHFMGKDVSIDTTAQSKPAPESHFTLKGNWTRVIFSGIPWACEGLGVYGFGVFLPVLIMALGIDKSVLSGMPKIINSVEVTAVVNSFIIPGFIIGLLMVRKVNNVKMLYVGFLFSALGLLLLWLSYKFKWDVIWMLAGFLIYEVALNAGPHLITYIIPTRVFPVSERAEGSGIAALIGKIGAIAGVILMPILLDCGGMTLVLWVSIVVMLVGGAIGLIFGKKLKLA